MVFGCTHRSRTHKNYVCRWHWRSAQGKVTAGIKARDKQGKPSFGFWSLFMFFNLSIDAGLKPVITDLDEFLKDGLEVDRADFYK